MEKNSNIIREASSIFQVQLTRSQGLTCLEFQITSSCIAKQCTTQNLGTTDAVDGMNINCGFKFQNTTNMGTVKQYEAWPDDLVQQ